MVGSLWFMSNLFGNLLRASGFAMITLTVVSVFYVVQATRKKFTRKRGLEIVIPILYVILFGLFLLSIWGINEYAII